eukprot:1296341-Rhodomonas_salina.1
MDRIASFDSRFCVRKQQHRSHKQQHCSHKRKQGPTVGVADDELRVEHQLQRQLRRDLQRPYAISGPVSAGHTRPYAISAPRRKSRLC